MSASTRADNQASTSGPLTNTAASPHQAHRMLPPSMAVLEAERQAQTMCNRWGRGLSTHQAGQALQQQPAAADHPAAAQGQHTRSRYHHSSFGKQCASAEVSQQLHGRPSTRTAAATPPTIHATTTVGHVPTSQRTSAQRDFNFPSSSRGAPAFRPGSHSRQPQRSDRKSSSGGHHKHTRSRAAAGGAERRAVAAVSCRLVQLRAGRLVGISCGGGVGGLLLVWRW